MTEGMEMGEEVEEVWRACGDVSLRASRDDKGQGGAKWTLKGQLQQSGRG